MDNKIVEIGIESVDMTRHRDGKLWKCLGIAITLQNKQVISSLIEVHQSAEETGTSAIKTRTEFGQNVWAEYRRVVKAKRTRKCNKGNTGRMYGNDHTVVTRNAGDFDGALKAIERDHGFDLVGEHSGIKSHLFYLFNDHDLLPSIDEVEEKNLAKQVIHEIRSVSMSEHYADLDFAGAF